MLFPWNANNVENLPTPAEMKQWQREQLRECRKRLQVLVQHVQAYEQKFGPLPELTEQEMTCEFEDLSEPKKQARLKQELIASGDWPKSGKKRA